MQSSYPPNLSGLYPIRWPAQLNDVKAFRLALSQYSDWANEQFVSADIDTLVQHRSYFIDSLLSHLWQRFKLTNTNVCLLAVGGYGRGVLHPCSDVDVLFLHQGELSSADAEQIGQLVTLLWDLKLDTGHSVRSVAHCLQSAGDDITIATNLIENRWICGDEKLAAQLQQRIYQDFPWSSRAFYQAKVDEQQSRHSRFHGTSYNLEPNIKSSPGGLRDIQTIGWIAKQHFRTKSDESLVEYHYISADELLELRECTSFLWRVRYALHVEAGKGEDRLLFDYQPGVAMRLGYGREGKRSVEPLMKDYFKVVLRVSELNRMLLQFFAQAILGERKSADTEILDQDFMISGHQLWARHDNVFARPQALMRFFLLIAEREDIEGIHSHTLRLLRNARAQLTQPLSHCPTCRDYFKAIVRHPRGFGLAFTLMHKHGIMANYLPQWQHIVGQMQFDLFHAYTVDEHTYRLLNNIYRFTLTDKRDDFALCSELVQQMDKPELLFLAGIFHDIAKGRGGDHSELGELDARHFCQQHEYSEDDADLVAWLVRQHLLMSVTAQKRDIYDPEVIQQFAKEVGSLTRLQYLYCLTVADIRATNSNLWNNWKATLLEELYHACAHVLQQDGENSMDVRARISQNKAGAMGLLLSAGYMANEVNQLWARFTADYFNRHTPEQIAWHSQAIVHLQEHQLPLILIGDENNHGTTELFIYHHEESHLFANVAAVLDGECLSIHDAQILNTRDGYVMDTFILLQTDGKPLVDAQRIEEVKQHLYDVLRKRRHAPTNQRRLPRRLRNFKVPTKVTFLAQKNSRRTTFELVTLDRPGLIATLAKVFQRLDITLQAAKITTIGEQAEDLFMVTDANHHALSESQCNRLKEAIISQLESHPSRQQ
ncbi:[protein-PII] uridylyltransferase [Aliidiomarina maris]|uniref:Bifunctional uridylyltransferase/uridylyl-removing enzyme n=1 Tax=Aliidiomarina maris TaxID=531312 RepID=A0A327WUJ0_9GAMM|nr:[protein-PII] uridylyltransferase [Aliidiomarina maris]RAJ96532.1 UTP--GlnB (protein PII) uridylyltransferase GlnD [Aliidiomarina maris]RUO23723.1 [protein-PII] uridylyltransferase [Aliidiomarina maris]